LTSDLFPARRARLVDLLVFADTGIVDEDVEALARRAAHAARVARRMVAMLRS
jgi:hypothetical protein